MDNPKDAPANVLFQTLRCRH